MQKKDQFQICVGTSLSIHIHAIRMNQRIHLNDNIPTAKRAFVLEIAVYLLFINKVKIILFYLPTSYRLLQQSSKLYYYE